MIHREQSEEARLAEGIEAAKIEEAAEEAEKEPVEETAEAVKQADAPPEEPSGEISEWERQSLLKEREERDRRQRQRTKAEKDERFSAMHLQYGDVDTVRFIAAFCVVAIHIRPLLNYSALGNFLFVDGLCRIAVPYFFLVSGYFWARKPTSLSSQLAFLGRIAILYALWTAIYYPVVLESWDMSHYLRRVFLTGSYHHLWYYPALLTASLLTFLCARMQVYRQRRRRRRFHRNSAQIFLPAVVLSGALYVVGCLGESYYSLICSVPGVEALAQRYFDLFWSTRNGLFFGFFFFALGALVRRANWHPKRWQAAAAFAGSLFFMAAEILTLRRLNLAKDYNMYISLIPAALFLFLMLTAAPERGLTAQGRKAPRSISAFFRNSSVLIFGSHLLFKYYGLKIADAAMHYSTDPQILATASLFAQNNLIQYIVVCLCSLAFAAAVLALSRLPVLRVLRYLY